MREAGRLRIHGLGERALGVLDRPIEILPEVCTEHRQRGRREARLHDRTFVGEIEDDRSLRELGRRRAAVGRDDDPRHGVEPFEELNHLGGRAAPTDRDDPVVAAGVRELRGWERVGFAAGFSQRGSRTTHIEGGAAADDRDPVAGLRELRTTRERQLGSPCPARGLTGDLVRDFAHSRETRPETLIRSS